MKMHSTFNKDKARDSHIFSLKDVKKVSDC